MKFIKADGNNRITTMVGNNNKTITVDGIKNKTITMAGPSQILTMVGETTVDLSHKTTVVGDMDQEMEMETDMVTVTVMEIKITVGATTMVGDFLQSSVDPSFKYL